MRHSINISYMYVYVDISSYVSSTLACVIYLQGDERKEVADEETIVRKRPHSTEAHNLHERVSDRILLLEIKENIEVCIFIKFDSEYIKINTYRFVYTSLIWYTHKYKILRKHPIVNATTGFFNLLFSILLYFLN